jgi:hypothetical protein
MAVPTQLASTLAGPPPITKQPLFSQNTVPKANAQIPTTVILLTRTALKPQHVSPMAFGSTAPSALTGTEYATPFSQGNYRWLTEHRFTDANTKTSPSTPSKAAPSPTTSLPMCQLLTQHRATALATWVSCMMCIWKAIVLELGKNTAVKTMSPARSGILVSVAEIVVQFRRTCPFVPLRLLSRLKLETWMHLLMNKQILQLLPLNRPLRPSLLRPPRLLHPRLTNLLLRPLEHRLHCASLQFHSLPRPNL